MTALKETLLRRIAATGPISLADYMAECLMHPAHGYYQQETVFGEDGDFTTAPEISQMFGEMVGLWLADRWIKMGRPSEINLIELGPGRGTLMADILRATEPVEDFVNARQVHFVEASAQLQSLQAEKVPDATWHADVSNLPEGPSLVVANEFFDALPIHQFEKLNGRWFERMVGEHKNALGFMLGPCGPQISLMDDATRSNAPEGAILEICPLALSITGLLARHIETYGGTALIIDYGYRKSGFGDTFQALKKHQFADPLAEPGKADLTAHVAFDQIAAAVGERARCFGPSGQGMFLMALGMGARAQHLATDLDDDGQQRILSELKRLTDPEEMGTLFKVMAIQARDLEVPPGF